MTNIHHKIQNTIDQYAIVLYMKGTPDFPMCGFSSTVVKILKQEGISFHAINVLEDHDIREGIKTFSQWPTIPQLYISGEFIGGCDIVNEMHTSGELKALLGTHQS